MPDFFKTFLHQDILDLGRSPLPVVRLAAFGKHPAWNDHMEDINLDTLALLEAKRYLYLQGISGQIDTGAWDPPPPRATQDAGLRTQNSGQGTRDAPPASGIPQSAFRIPHFNHWLLWHRPGEILLGRLLASTDGKGRARYPLVILAHIINLPLAPALDTLAPLIDEAARAARAATTPDAVRRVIHETRARLNTLAQNAPDSAAPLPDGLRPTLTPTGWTRFYHALETQLRPFAPGERLDTSTPCRHLRLPAAGATPLQSLLWWNACLLTQLAPQSPLLLIAPEGADQPDQPGHAYPQSPFTNPKSKIQNPKFLDLIVGEPASPHFRCLLTSLSALPVVTDTPYEVAPDIMQFTNEFLQNPGPGLLPNRSLFRPKPPTLDAALATIATRAGLAHAVRPPGFLGKLFG